MGVEAGYWDGGLGGEGFGDMGEMDAGVVYVCDSCGCGAGDQGEEKGGLMLILILLFFCPKDVFFFLVSSSFLLGYFHGAALFNTVYICLG